MTGSRRRHRRHRRVVRSTVTKNVQREKKDWSELPQDMLHLISKKLPDVLEFVRFRAVCQQWRSSALVTDPLPKHLWLIRNQGPGFIKRISISFSRSPKLTSIGIPESQGKLIKGSYYGYVLTFDKLNFSLYLLNPLTKREIRLPPIDVKKCFPISITIGSVGNRGHVAFFSLKDYPAYTLASCELGDDNWKTIELNVQCCKRCCSSYAYFNGTFFVYSRYDNVTKVIDATTGSLKHAIPSPDTHRFKHFVESCGKLIGIKYRGYLFEAKSYFEIYELDYQNENPRWVRITSIGDQFLFVHHISGGLSLKASDFPGFKQNCIYFFENAYLGRIDMNNGMDGGYAMKKLPFPEDVLACFLPSLN